MKLDSSLQPYAVRHVTDAKQNFKVLTEEWRERMARVYDAVTTFESKKANDWDTAFKVNRAFEIENRWLSRLFAKAPNPIVSVRTDIFDEEDRVKTEEERAEALKLVNTYARAAQDYLKQVFNRPDQKRKIRNWARSMARYGMAHAEVQYRSVLRPSFGADGSKKDKVIDEYPTIENVSWTDCYFDPRYTTLSEMPGFITVRRGVRLSELKANREYFNLDAIESLPDYSSYKEDVDGWKSYISNIAGIPASSVTGTLDKNSIDVTKYYGWWSPKGDARDEKHVELTVAGDLLLIGYKEITEKPIEKISAFDDPETYLATGVVEPMISLMDENNFKKNAAASYINLNLSRPVIWSPISGVNPRDLVEAGRRNGGIIPTSGDAQTAIQNVVEYPLRNIDASYFQEQNNFERDIQNVTFTVDTSQQPGQQALTNTATGAKIKFFESNAVVAMVRDNFEEGLRSLCYKLLMSAFENIKGNVVIKKAGDNGFWEVNKEAFRNAMERFDVQIEVDSSSLEGPANRRDDAIAKANLLTQAKAQGVNVDMEQAYRDILSSMEGTNPDKYILPAPVAQQPAEGGGGRIPMMPNQPSEAAQFTQDILGQQAMMQGA